jgi:hypothetical protein
MDISLFKRSAAPQRRSLSAEMGILAGLVGVIGSVLGLGLGML